MMLKMQQNKMKNEYIWYGCWLALCLIVDSKIIFRLMFITYDVYGKLDAKSFIVETIRTEEYELIDDIRLLFTYIG